MSLPSHLFLHAVVVVNLPSLYAYAMAAQKLRVVYKSLVLPRTHADRGGHCLRRIAEAEHDDPELADAEPKARRTALRKVRTLRQYLPYDGPHGRRMNGSKTMRLSLDRARAAVLRPMSCAGNRHDNIQRSSSLKP